ncbi:hypothetical protein GH733_018756, partial [Mirounga leonina]
MLPAQRPTRVCPCAHSVTQTVLTREGVDVRDPFVYVSRKRLLLSDVTSFWENAGNSQEETWRIWVKLLYPNGAKTVVMEDQSHKLQNRVLPSREAALFQKGYLQEENMAALLQAAKSQLEQAGNPWMQEREVLRSSCSHLETRKSNPKEVFSEKESCQGISMERSTGADTRASSLKEAWGYAEIKENGQDRLWKEATVICKKRTSRTDSKPKYIESGRRVSLKSDFVIQSRYPEEERPYTSHAQGRSFKQNAKLIRHQKDSPNEKTLQCNVRSKIFSDHSVYVQHRIAHSGENNLKCNQYGKTFGHGIHCTEHQKTNIGEKS